jgi:trans-aconitate 2-methyltransferase
VALAMTAINWDAGAYDRISDMQLESGREFLAGVSLRGDETAIDAGCGTGRVTRLLAERLPRGRVIGVDASEAMIAQSRANLDSKVELVTSDLLEFEPTEPVDLVFSTAALHWIDDQDRLFRTIHDWLHPGGRVAAQFGGAGNLREVLDAIVSASRREPFTEHLDGLEHPWTYPSIDEATERLARTGFTEFRCELVELPFEFDDPREFHRTVYLVVHLERLPAELHDEFIDAVMAGQSDPSTAHFLHMNLAARRPLREDGDG